MQPYRHAVLAGSALDDPVTFTFSL